jgi:hypothetical protein
LFQEISAFVNFAEYFKKARKKEALEVSPEKSEFGKRTPLF